MSVRTSSPAECRPAVTHASVVFWEYYEVIRLHAPTECVARIQRSIELVDRILQVNLLRKPLKRLFGLEDLEHDEDFASVLEAPLGGWQGASCDLAGSSCLSLSGRNWDPAVSGTGFETFCAALEGEQGLPPVKLGPFELDPAVLNYAAYVKGYVAAHCPEGYNVEEVREPFPRYPCADVLSASGRTTRPSMPTSASRASGACGCSRSAPSGATS